jgi:hypothetical protein
MFVLPAPSSTSNGKRLAAGSRVPRASLLVLFLVGEHSGRKGSFYSMLCRCDATNGLFRSWSPGPEVRCEYCNEWHDLQDSNDPIRYFLKVSPQTLRELQLLAGVDDQTLAGAASGAPPIDGADDSGDGSDQV